MSTKNNQSVITFKIDYFMKAAALMENGRNCGWNRETHEMTRKSSHHCIGCREGTVFVSNFSPGILFVWFVYFAVYQ